MRSHRRRGPRPNRQRVPSGAEIADAFRSIFGSKAEVDEMFAEFEAKLVRTVNEVYGRYKEARDAEWGLARAEEPRAADRSAEPVVKVT